MLTFLSGLIGFHNRYDKSKVSENLIKWLGRQKKILWFAKEESRGTVIEYAAKIIMLLLIIAISLRLTIYKNEEMFLFYVSMAGRTLFISILSVHALLWSFGKVVIELRTGNTIKVIEDIAINMLFYACVLFTVGYFI